MFASKPALREASRAGGCLQRLDARTKCGLHSVRAAAPQNGWQTRHQPASFAAIARPDGTGLSRLMLRAVSTPAAAAGAASAAAASVVTPESKFRFRGAAGTVVEVVLRQQAGSTHIELDTEQEPGTDGGGLQLHWGMYRATVSKWHHPAELVPADSKLDARTGAMRTPFQPTSSRAGSSGSSSSRLGLSFDVPSKLAPLHLGFVLYHPGTGRFEGPASGGHFSVPIGITAGSPGPLGAVLVAVTEGRTPQDAACSINFAVYARHATGMSLCLVRSGSSSGGGFLEIALNPEVHRTGDTWHVCVNGLKGVAALCYGWRANGSMVWDDGGRYHPGYLLLDPYARLAQELPLPPSAFAAAPVLPPGDTDKTTAVLGSLAHFVSDFDWGTSQPPAHAVEDTIIYHLNLDAAAAASGGGSSVRGGYLAAARSVPTIKASGATAILLGPVQLSAAPGDGSSSRPLSFFAPETKYSSSGSALDASHELKQLVRTAHEAGIEVIAQLEFCLTAEGSDRGAHLLSLRGLDAGTYYRGENEAVLNSGHAIVRRLIRDSLRHWATEYQLDGFCFINAENLVQDRAGTVQDAPPLAEELALDPVLRRRKLIALSGDDALLPRAGVRGFPHWGVWLQWNNTFSSDLANYLTSDQWFVWHATVAAQLGGRPAMFAAGWESGLPGQLATPRRPCFGVNPTSSLAGESLMQAMGAEENLEQAETRSRTLLLMALVGQGVPVVSAATLQRKGLLRFVSVLAQVRRRLKQLLLLPAVERELTWHSAFPGGQPDFDGTQLASGESGWGANYMGFRIAHTPAAHPDTDEASSSGGASSYSSSNSSSSSSNMSTSKAVYAGFNPHYGMVDAAVPAPPPGMVWRRLVDTSRLPPEDATVDEGPILAGNSYLLNPQAAILLEAVADSGAVPAAAAAAGAQL